MLESPCNYEIHLKIRNEHNSRQSCKTKLFLCDNQLVELNWLSRSEWNIWLHCVLHSKWISLVNSYQACNLLSNLHRKVKILCNIIFSLFFYFGQRKMKCCIMVIYSTLPLLKMAIPWDFGIDINNIIEMIPTDNRHSTYSLSIVTFFAYINWYILHNNLELESTIIISILPMWKVRHIVSVWLPRIVMMSQDSVCPVCH